MASTYSPSLKITLPGDGDQSGLWGQTTNTNLGTLLEQAITGVVSITMSDANYTLTSFNGVSDEARNAVLVVTGTNNAVRDLIPPLVEKLYTVFNNTTGGNAIRVIGSSGTGVNIPNGTGCLVYCDGTNFYAGLSGTSGSFSVNGTLNATTVTATTGTFTNVSGNGIALTAINASNITSGTLVNARTTASDANGASTIVARDANGSFAGNVVTATTVTATTGTFTNVSGNGAALTGINASNVASGTLVVARGGTGQTSLTVNNVILGNGTSAVQVIAPGAAGNVLTSNGTTWVSAAPTIPAAGDIGSYCFAYINANGNINVPVFGDVYAAGTGANEIQSAIISNQPSAGFFNVVLTNNLTGNWRWLGGSNGTVSVTNQFGIAVRVS
jgi:hypothetical protein